MLISNYGILNYSTPVFLVESFIDYCNGNFHYEKIYGKINSNGSSYYPEEMLNHLMPTTYDLVAEANRKIKLVDNNRFIFRANISIMNSSPLNALGRIYIQLLDEMSEVILHMGGGDGWAGNSGVSLYCSIFDNRESYVLYESGWQASKYTNFNGELKVIKDNNTWTFYINGNQMGTINRGVVKEIEAIKIGFQAMKGYPVVDLKVYEIELRNY